MSHIIERAQEDRTPGVSVIMTAFNAEAFVAEAVRSALEQSYRDLEVIVVDDGSTDGTRDVLRGFVDSRLQVIEAGRNIGRTAALNLALSHARAEFIANLDADDISAPDRIGSQVEFLRAHPEIGVVGSWCRVIDEQGRPKDSLCPPALPAETRDCLAWDNPIAHSAAMFRRRLAVELGGYPSDIVYAQDFALWLAIAGRAGLANIPEFLTTLRHHGGNMTFIRRYKTARAQEGVLLFARAIAMGGYSIPARQRARRNMGIVRGRLGLARLAEGKWLAGLFYLIWGMCLSPKYYLDHPKVRRWTGLGRLSTLTRPLRRRFRP